MRLRKTGQDALSKPRPAYQAACEADARPVNSLTGSQAVMVIEIRAQSTCGFFGDAPVTRATFEFFAKLLNEKRFDQPDTQFICA